MCMRKLPLSSGQLKSRGQAYPIDRWFPAKVRIKQYVGFAQAVHGLILEQEQPQKESFGLIAEPCKSVLGCVPADVQQEG